MPTRDTAQLILEVDARIATAQRAVNQLARSIQSDSASMEKSLDGVAKSHARIGQALNDNGRIRAGFTQLSFQIGDVTQQMSLGVNGARIFAQQSGQVIQALQVMGGEGNKFLQFLGGPWGIAISTAAVILAPFASKLFDTGDEVGKLVDKMREQARQAALNNQADVIWKGTIEGLTEAIRKRREEQQKSLQTDVLQEASDRRAAQKELDDLTRQRDRLSKQISGFIAANRSQAGGPGPLGHNVVEESDRKLAQLQTKLDGVNRQIAVAEANVRGADIPILDRRAEGRIDSVKAATDVYNASLGALHAQYVAGQITLRKYNTELDRLKANLKAVQDAAKDSGQDRQSGRQVSFAEATAIAKAGGLQVNSGFRSVAEQRALFNDPRVNRPGNPVAAPGASAHNGANGKWAIDIQITDGVTPGKIRKVFADQGVSLTKVLKEQGHFHIEGSRSEAAAADKAQQTEANKAQDRQQAFESETDRLNAAIVQARTQLVQGVDAQADLGIKQLQVEQDDYGRALDRQVADHKLNAADAETLKLKYAQLTFEKAKAIEIQRQVQHLQQADEADQRQFQYRIDDLRFADEMATTQSEHRQLQLDILDVVYQQKEAHLRALKAELELAGKLEEASSVQAQIDRLPTERAEDRSRVAKGTMNPLEAWAHEVPRTAAEINEALQSIEAQGLGDLSSGIADAGLKFLGLADQADTAAGRIIRAILEMTAKMLIFRLISGALGGGSIATPDSSFSMPVGVNLGNTGPANIPHLAGGGVFSVGGRGGIDRNLLSINGQARAMVGADEQIAVIPRAANFNPAPRGPGGGPIELTIGFGPAPEFAPYVMQVAAAAGQQAVNVSVKHTNDTIRTIARPKLSGRG